MEWMKIHQCGVWEDPSDLQNLKESEYNSKSVFWLYLKLKVLKSFEAIQSLFY